MQQRDEPEFTDTNTVWREGRLLFAPLPFLLFDGILRLLIKLLDA